jgi:hypothetical protein
MGVPARGHDAGELDQPLDDPPPRHPGGMNGSNQLAIRAGEPPSATECGRFLDREEVGFGGKTGSCRSPR